MRHAGACIKRGEVELVILSNTDYHAFHGFTGEFLNGFLDLKWRRSPVSELMKHATYVKGYALGVDQNCNEIIYYNEDRDRPKVMKYDELVVGIGSFDDSHSIKGIKQYALSVKKEGGIAQCRNHILQKIKEAERTASQTHKERLLTFNIIGAGFAGVEVCGNLCEYLECLKDDYPVLREGYRVNLIHSGSCILPQLKSKFGLMRRYTAKVLRKYGVNIIRNTRVKEIDENGVMLSDHTRVEGATVICTVGQRRLNLASTHIFQTTDNGAISCDGYLRAEGYDNIWVGGDMADVRQPYTDHACRSDALWAIKHGERIGKNLARKIAGRPPGKFRYPGLGQTASLGKNKAILELYGLQFVGPMAWLNRIGFFLYFYPLRNRVPAVLKALFAPRKKFDLKKKKAAYRVMRSPVAVIH